MASSNEMNVADQDPLARALTESAQLVSTYLPQTEAIRAELLRQLREQRCEILVFGAYNAGKSTLINALLGAERAAVRDVPTTATIDRYDFGPWVLLDTPGVNAPIEHEQTTREALRAAHLVLFVAREGDQDVADLYARLFEILAAGSAVLMVLNHSMTQAEDIEPLRLRMLELLDDWRRRHGHGPELLDQLPVVPVNARLALRGRLEGKASFLATSGLEDLRFRMEAWLKQAEAKAGWRQRIAARSLGEVFRPLRAVLEQRLGSPTALAQVDEQLLVMNGRIDQIDARLQLLARAHVQRSKADIGSALDAGLSKPEQIETRLQQIAEAGLKALVEQLSEDIQTLGDALAISHRQADIPPPDLEKLLAGSGSVLGHIEAALGKASVEGLKQVKPEHLVEVMKWLRKMKVPWFKGRWEKTFGKWAGKAAPWLVLAAGVIELVLELRDQERQNAQQRSAVMQRHQVIEDLAMSIQAAQEEFIGSQMAEVRQRLLAPLRDERARLAAEAGELADELERVLAWETEVRRVAGHA